MLRALIFDFDGVLVDSEPLIFELTKKMAAKEGWKLTKEEYYRDYLALDDRGIVGRLYRSHGRKVDAARRDALVAWKAREYEELIRDGLPPLAGAVEFVRKAAAKYPLAIAADARTGTRRIAIASGSLRSEIERLLRCLGLREAFRAIVSADDCEQSKPAPEVYLKALGRLAELEVFVGAPLEAGQCLAIEDAPLGIVAAHAAGMKCLALAQSCPVGELRHADWVIRSFAEADLVSLASDERWR